MQFKVPIKTFKRKDSIKQNAIFFFIRNEKGRITEISSRFINMCKGDNDECCLVKGAGGHIIICFSGWSQLCGSLHLHRTLKYFCVQVIDSFLMDLKVAVSVTSCPSCS